MRRAGIALALLLASCGGSGHVRLTPSPPPATGGSLDVATVEIGPVIEGRNYSQGVPLHPFATADGWAFNVPQLPGSVHYVTMARTAPLQASGALMLHYRIEAAPGTQLLAVTSPGAPGLLTLYFQRRGDNWDGTGKYEAYRWFATFATASPLGPGEGTIAAPFSANWTAVQTSSRANNPQAFAAALANPGRIGFVLGGGTGYGHGVYATAPARFVVTGFEVTP